MTKSVTRIGALVLAVAGLTTPAFAQRRDRGDNGNRDRGGSVQRAEPRSRDRGRADDNNRDRGRSNGNRGRDRAYDNRYRSSRPTYIVPSRPYNYGYRPYTYRAPFGYRPYGYRPGWSASLYFGRPYRGYRYGSPYGYYSLVPGGSYGAVRIVDAPRDAQVLVDGYYAGVVDDYDGVFQHLNLEAGVHRIEIEAPGWPPIEFDVRIIPGETITYHARP